MSVTKSEARAAAPVFTPPPATQSPIDIAVSTLKANAAQLGLACPGDYNLVQSGSRSVQIWIPGGAKFGVTRAAFEKIFSAIGYKAQAAQEYGLPVTEWGDPKVSFLDRITYTFQVESKGSADV